VKLNGTDYPTLGPNFLRDLKIELGMDPDAVGPQPLPVAYDREFPQIFEVTKSLRGLSFRTVPGDPPRILATWCYPRPDGSARTIEVTIPEQVRAAMAASPASSGDEMVTAVYEATLPEVQAAFNMDWGIVP
jgi:hypothetical protein